MREVNMKYNILDIANWFLSKESMQHKKLQKLSYYFVAWGYALYNKKLVDDDIFQAWIHGPVSATLYTKYKGYGWNYIEQLPNCILEDKEIVELLVSLWETYGYKS